MVQYAFHFDGERCTGCKTCQLACADYNDLTCDFWYRRIYEFGGGAWEQGEDGTWSTTAFTYHASVACNHCESPACVANCPTLAMHKTVDGVVLHDDARCVQCRNCVTVCPYGAPQFDDEADMIVKCDSCYDLRKGGMNPTCVDACPTRALEFGDIDELRRQHGTDCVSEIPVLGTADHTHPNLLVKANDAAVSPSFAKVAL